MYGPNSKELRDRVRQCDQFLGYLMSQINNSMKLRDNLHLIVTSDHGMEPINDSTNKAPILLVNYVDMTKFAAYGDMVVISVFSYSGLVDSN